MEKKSKTLLEMIKELLHIAAPETATGPEAEILPEPPDSEVVERLISKATTDPTVPKVPKDPEEPPRSCPYATKRAIVESLNEIRRFAEEHQLATTVVRALLTMLAEMAIGALKGKVSGAVLEALLKAFNYERDKQRAYEQGELDGRNATIIETHFPEPNNPPGTDGLPHVNGIVSNPEGSSNIFELARSARD
jgi:hypothetical protein